MKDKEDNGERKDLSSSSSSQQCRRFSLDEIKFATCNFDDALVIGEGGFGKVYKGTIDFGVNVVVAIKRLALDSNQGETEFRAEIKMLSKFRHSHIVSLLGYFYEPGQREMILVYEYMSNGSLDDHLHKSRADGSNSSPLTWNQRLRICIGAARGLDYLHTGTGVQHRVIHRDVKSSNILLDENWEGKISDFGLSRKGPADLSCTTKVYTDKIRGTFGYMDEEYISTGRLTRKSDLYAFGVVLFEVLCGRQAVDLTLDEQQHSLAGWAKHCFREGTIDRIVDPCLRGQISANCLKEFGKIAYKCLRRYPKDRPTMTQVLAKLESVFAFSIRAPAARTKNFDTNKPQCSDKNKGVNIEEKSTAVEKWGGGNKINVDARKDGGATSASGTSAAGGQIVAPNLKVFTLVELRSATRNFWPSNLREPRGFEQVFKGWVDGVTYAPSKVGVGIAVAVKKSHADSRQDLKKWQAQVKILGKFNHPNLVKLMGYCCEDTDFQLVYEDTQKGSLHNHLFTKEGEPLSWDARIKIAVGAGKGLAFLHSTEKPVIHRGVKSSNILLDTDFNAKLSSCGLVKLGPTNGESHVSTHVVQTIGYSAPEYIATGHLNVKSDVYGFGVVMLEMITGLNVLDLYRLGCQHNLIDCVRPLLSDIKKLRRIMDPRLEHGYPSEGAGKVAELILNCLDPVRKERPSMQDVVTRLEGINVIPRESKVYN